MKCKPTVPSSDLELFQLWCLPTPFLSGWDTRGGMAAGSHWVGLCLSVDYLRSRWAEALSSLPRLQEPPLFSRSSLWRLRWVRERRDMHKGRNPEIPRTKITSFSTTSTPTLHPRGRAAKFQKLKWLERKENYSVAQYLHKKLLTFSFPIFSLWAGPQTWIPTHMHTRMRAQIYVSHTRRLDVHGKPSLTPSWITDTAGPLGRVYSPPQALCLCSSYCRLNKNAQSKSWKLCFTQQSYWGL